jgi:hypothetical protein
MLLSVQDAREVGTGTVVPVPPEKLARARDHQYIGIVCVGICEREFDQFGRSEAQPTRVLRVKKSHGNCTSVFASLLLACEPSDVFYVPGPTSLRQSHNLPKLAVDLALDLLI